MSRALGDAGKVALYGINFDTDKDTLRADSEPTLKEIAKLLTTNRGLNIRVVGHTDNQGKADYNLDLSRRRAAAVVRELEHEIQQVAANRLDSFGCGLYAPAASNDSEDGRAKNRRVELPSSGRWGGVRGPTGGDRPHRWKSSIEPHSFV